MTKVILASKSAARQALLKGAGVVFDARGADVDEEAVKGSLEGRGLDPRATALELAVAKAVETSKVQEGLVIGADQTLDLDGERIGRARRIADARVQLRALRGRRHQLHSAVAVAKDGDLLWSNVQSAALTMRDFSDRFLDDYLSRNTDAVLASVGGYQLEGEGIQLFESIEGEYFTILGLPLPPLLAFLRDRGVLEA